MLQRVLGINVDGRIGDATIAAAKAADSAQVVNAICDERLAFLRGLKTWPVFGAGWGRRVAEVRALALKMASASFKEPVIIATAGGAIATVSHALGAEPGTVIGILAVAAVAAIVFIAVRKIRGR